MRHDQHPAFIEADPAFLEPARFDQLVVELAGPLAQTGRRGALVVGELDLRMGGQYFPNQRLAVRVGDLPALVRTEPEWISAATFTGFPAGTPRTGQGLAPSPRGSRFSDSAVRCP